MSLLLSNLQRVNHNHKIFLTVQYSHVPWKSNSPQLIQEQLALNMVAYSTHMHCGGWVRSP